MPCVTRSLTRQNWPRKHSQVQRSERHAFGLMQPELSCSNGGIALRSRQLPALDTREVAAFVLVFHEGYNF